MMRVGNFVYNLDLCYFIEEHLSVSKQPVSREKHGERSCSKNVDCSFVEQVIEEWWLFVPVSEAKTFHHVNVEDAE